ncbi:hypothetical protein K501DRAFT_275724 [Backusella circina FSU 941]|nr:hypothetical protein K501DRAFT_275724 [Backusella circina FSU 941]
MSKYFNPSGKKTANFSEWVKLLIESDSIEVRFDWDSGKKNHDHVKGDGFCGFRAISVQVYGNEGLSFKVNTDSKLEWNTGSRYLPTQTFLEALVSGELSELLDKVYAQQLDSDCHMNDKKAINLIKYIMSDCHVNCEKSSYYTDSNDRTPYCKHSIPIFKCFSAVYKNVSFMWCEKGLVANKQLAICLDDEHKKVNGWYWL